MVGRVRQGSSTGKTVYRAWFGGGDSWGVIWWRGGSRDVAGKKRPPPWNPGAVGRAMFANEANTATGWRGIGLAMSSPPATAVVRSKPARSALLSGLRGGGRLRRCGRGGRSCFGGDFSRCCSGGCFGCGFGGRSRLFGRLLTGLALSLCSRLSPLLPLKLSQSRMSSV